MRGRTYDITHIDGTFKFFSINTVDPISIGDTLRLKAYSTEGVFYLETNFRVLKKTISDRKMELVVRTERKNQKEVEDENFRF